MGTGWLDQRALWPAEIYALTLFTLGMGDSSSARTCYVAHLFAVRGSFPGMALRSRKRAVRGKALPARICCDARKRNTPAAAYGAFHRPRKRRRGFHPIPST